MGPNPPQDIRYEIQWDGVGFMTSEQVFRLVRPDRHRSEFLEINCWHCLLQDNGGKAFLECHASTRMFHTKSFRRMEGAGVGGVGGWKRSIWKRSLFLPLGWGSGGLPHPDSTFPRAPPMEALPAHPTGRARGGGGVPGGSSNPPGPCIENPTTLGLQRPDRYPK